MHWCRSRGHFWGQIYSTALQYTVYSTALQYTIYSTALQYTVYSTALQKKECKREDVQIMEYRTIVKYEDRSTRVQVYRRTKVQEYKI